MVRALALSASTIYLALRLGLEVELGGYIGEGAALGSEHGPLHGRDCFLHWADVLFVLVFIGFGLGHVLG